MFGLRFTFNETTKADLCFSKKELHTRTHYIIGIVAKFHFSKFTSTKPNLSYIENKFVPNRFTLYNTLFFLQRGNHIYAAEGHLDPTQILADNY